MNHFKTRPRFPGGKILTKFQEYWTKMWPLERTQGKKLMTDDADQTILLYHYSFIPILFAASGPWLNKCPLANQYRFIDCMVFSTVFNSILRLPVLLPMFSWSSLYQHNILSSHWLLSHITIVETMDRGERRMNPVVMTIINPWKEYWLRLFSV